MESWSCTNQLRWVVRERWTEPEGLLGFTRSLGKGRVLQQLWVSEDGEEKWRDVPVEEGE